MAPRSGKRRRRCKLPIPIWLPLPRPRCLRSLHLPGSCYMPVPPNYLTWTIPPSYYMKPVCHCADENFCTTSNCPNSKDCLKQNLTFCPHDNKDEQIPDAQPDSIREDENEKEEDISKSESNICSSCGALPAGSRGRKSEFTSKRELEENTMQCRAPRFSQNERFYSPSHSSEQQQKQHNVHEPKSRQTLDPINSGKVFVPLEKRIDASNEENESSDASYISKLTKSPQQGNRCVNSSCQTPCKLERALINSAKRRNNIRQRRNRSLTSTTSDAEDAENSTDANSMPTSGIKIPPSYDRNGANVSDSTVPANLESNKSREIVKDAVENESLNRTTDKIYTQQLPEHLSQARKALDNDTSNCCTSTPGAGIRCKNMQMDIVKAGNEEHKGIPSKASMYRKATECGCSSKKNSMRNTTLKKVKDTSNLNISEANLRSPALISSGSGKEPSKTSSMPRKVSKCICTSNKALTRKSSFKGANEMSNSSRANTKSSALTCESCKTSKLDKMTECGCSSTKLSARKSSSKKIQDTPSSYPFNPKSNCQCRFPPAFNHLSCSGSISGNCSCSKNPLKD